MKGDFLQQPGHHFQCLSSRPFNPQSLLYLNREGYLLLIFDGFDEVIAYSEPSRHVEHLKQILRSAEGEAKAILTCRTHYFRDRPDEIRALGGQSSELLTDGATRLYEELSKKPGVNIAYLREFTTEQIEQYLQKAVPPPGNWLEFHDQIQHTYNLRDLAERPFLLEMIVKTLPKLQSAVHASQVTVADLYATYCESWFDHTDFRLTLTRERKVALVEHLARKLWNTPDQRVHYRDLFEDCTSFFSDRPLTPHEKDKIDFEVRTALFLHRDESGHYSFIHRSFLEFFVARTLQVGLRTGDPGCLDCRRLTREVVFFLAFWPEAEKVPALASKVLAGPYQRRISENALQVLSFYTRSLVAPLVGPASEARDTVENLRRIRHRFRTLSPAVVHLEGADLDGADLRGIDLEGSSLIGVRLDRASLQGASFASANLKEASLAFANAWEASFAHACLISVHLEHAQCLGADFKDADLTGADLSFCRVDPSLMREAPPPAIEAIEAGLPDVLDSIEPASWKRGAQLARQITVLLTGSGTEIVVSRMATPMALVAVPRDWSLPTSPSQELIWFLNALNPESPYQLMLAFELSGRLLLSALRKSVSEVVRRHELLRATFPESDGRPIHQITPRIAVTLPLIDLRGLPEPMRWRIAHHLISEETHLSSDPARGPLFRPLLLALSSNKHIVVLAMHRLIGDERSLELLVRELGLLYGAFSRGTISPLPEPTLQFIDVAAWQRRRQLEVLTTDLVYWREKMAGAPTTLKLPTDRPRPTVLSTRGARQQLKIADDLAGTLRTLANSRRATPLMAFLAAFDLLLSRYADYQDIVIGLPVHGRQYAAFENLIGPFSDFRVLRTDLSGIPSFEEVLVQVRGAVLAAHASELLFHDLVNQLKPERDLAQTPLFQATFSLRKKSNKNSFDQLTIKTIDPDSIETHFELSMTIDETAAGFDAGLIYPTGLFDSTTTQRMLRHFKSIIDDVTASPFISLNNIHLLSANERQQTTVEWNDSATFFVQSKLCLHELFAAQVSRTPDAQAVIFEDQVLTYSQLNRLADRLADQLSYLGVSPEIHVAVLLERSFEMIAGIIAVLKIGGAYVPLDPTFPPERLLSLLHDSGALVLLTQRRILEKLPQLNIRVLCLDEPCLTAQTKHSSIPPSMSPDNLCYVIYTSGSTGSPKGVMTVHGGVVGHLLGMQAMYPLLPEDRVLQRASLVFDFSVQEIFWPLISGASLVLAEPSIFIDPLSLARVIEEQRVTVLTLVPSLAHVLFKELSAEAYCASLRRVVVGGEALSEDLKNLFFERLGNSVEVINIYGPTEATINVTSCRLAYLWGSVSIGRPIANARVYILDRQLRRVPIGVPGQLYIGGVQVARGYHRWPALTSERFNPDPFSTEPGGRLYATGDLARLNEQGEIEYLGRVDHQVKIRGFRVELGEIESALSHHPKVREAVVVAREEYPGKRRLVAYIVPEKNISAAELRKHLQNQLPAYMVPASFVSLPALPRGPSGKIDRRALPAPATEGGEFVPPRNPVEQSLTQIWSEMLGIEGIGVNDHFFALGGHSLLATRLVSRIRDFFQLELPLRYVFDAPTVAELAKIITKGRQGQLKKATPK